MPRNTASCMHWPTPCCVSAPVDWCKPPAERGSPQIFAHEKQHTYYEWCYTVCLMSMRLWNIMQQNHLPREPIFWIAQSLVRKTKILAPRVPRNSVAHGGTVFETRVIADRGMVWIFDFPVATAATYATARIARHAPRAAHIGDMRHAARSGGRCCGAGRRRRSE